MASHIPRIPALKKSPTGINGFDDITMGGVPSGRPTLVCGSAGCGKSLFALEFLIRGAIEFGEPGVLLTFEETAEDIRKNAASLGFHVDDLIAKKKLIIDFIKVDRCDIEETGEYDLEGLFIRLAHSIAAIKAKRVVLDTIEALFAGLSNQAVLRSEIRRLFGWLKDHGMTTVVTGERGEGQLTRQGLEEYVSDCVVLLDHRVIGQIPTRRLRIVKYRGSAHGTNEYPFLIDEEGISVLPITASGLDYPVSNERMPTGVQGLDEMLGGRGYYRGSTVLLTGTAGTGKTSIAAQFAETTCQRGEKCLYFSFEESEAQILRNMRSIGIMLERFTKTKLLKFYTTRPTVHGLEMHLVQMHKLIEEFKPSVVIVDPVSNMRAAGTLTDSTNMLIRLVDFLRRKRILGFLISLNNTAQCLESTEEGLSSIVDSWLLLRDVEFNGERNRLLYILKSRGMAHSNQVREFLITSGGIRLVDVYLGQEGVITGSARTNLEARDAIRAQEGRDEILRKKLLLEHRRKTVEAQIEALRTGLLAEDEEFERARAQEQTRTDILNKAREVLASRRGVADARRRRR